ncbi:PREDICTED: putative histone deacetylase 10 [Nelumbo nucifera]|uniref:Histone deacetylase 10 n=1 Tax=Nelumbo nucifera TaxID=4432 RepID=A0A1U7YR82_NELNU|nr:PREDICTED: putative histone deacetylase 10 [Nelumbo nucifera]
MTRLPAQQFQFEAPIDRGHLISHWSPVFDSHDSFLCFRNEIPDNAYIEYFAPEYSLKIPTGNMDNLNSKSYLGTIKMQVLENLRCIQHAPSVQMQEVPPDFYIPDFDEDEQNPDERVDQHTQDKQIQRDDEYYEGDNDNDHMDDT